LIEIVDSAILLGFSRNNAKEKKVLVSNSDLACIR